MNIIKIFLIFPLEDYIVFEYSIFKYLMLVLMFVKELDYLIIYHRVVEDGSK